ncbi:hypothetical protein [Reyranella massiliensis]|uniref:hypothetical protein n=1 Tax=Reyranella massiliensis TaxID=445220 RepID=UPI00031D1BF2|nr:hypothetical protein [Reyranella massiliensis]
MPGSDIETLKRRAFDRQAEARAAVRAYGRASWIRFAATFIPVPLVVVLFRLYLVDWHYYILGGAFIVIAMLMYALDTRAADRRDRALAAAKEARAAYRRARKAARGGA